MNGEFPVVVATASATRMPLLVSETRAPGIALPLVPITFPEMVVAPPPGVGLAAASAGFAPMAGWPVSTRAAPSTVPS